MDRPTGEFNRLVYDVHTSFVYLLVKTTEDGWISIDNFTYIILVPYTRASLAGGWAPPATLAEGGIDIQ